MKVFVVSKNSQTQDPAYTSLKELCDEFKLSYSTAISGKRIFVTKQMDVISIKEVEVSKIKGRENNFKTKQNENKND